MKTATLVWIGLLTTGCLEDGDKRACETAGDCADGVLCLEQVCGGPDDDGDGIDIGDGRDDGGGGSDDGDGPGGAFEERGSFEPFAPASWAVGAHLWTSGMVGVSDLGGAVGCASASDWFGAPGRAASRVFLASAADDLDCADQSIAVQPAASCRDWASNDAPDGCAVYQRWDAGGALVAQRLASGGAIAITATPLETTCRLTVEVDLSFGSGDDVVQTTFTVMTNFEDEATCVH